MTFTAVVIFVVALVAPSLCQTWGNNGGTGGYIDGLVGNINKNRPGQSGCYDRCRDAYFSNRGSNFHVSGCVCSRFDFSNIGGQQGGRFGGNRFDRNCNQACPIGTYCDQEFGRWTCVPTHPIDNRRPGGPIRPGNDHCGYVKPECLASPGSYNAQWRYTYDYTLRQCVKVQVDAACAYSYGVSGNIFQSQADCSRQCEFNRSY